MANNRDSSVFCYADDTTLSCSAHSRYGLIDELSLQINKVTQFMTDNHLKVNDDKSQLIVFGKKMRRHSEIDQSVYIQTPTTVINPSSNVKSWGVTYVKI